jgi:PAS domain S-box-containing protein
VDTDRHRALAWLAAIVQTTDDAILSSDENDIVTTWNPAAEQLFGYSAMEMIGQSVLIIVPSELLGERQRFIDRLNGGEVPGRFETRRRRKDGTLIDVEMTVSPVHDEHGRSIGYSSIVRDTTERRQSEAKIRELEFRYQTFFEYMPGLTYIHSPTVGAPAEVLEYSHQFGVLTGYPAAMWVADRDFLYKIVHPDDRERLIASDQAVIDGRGIQEVEFRIITADGHVIWLQDRAQLVFGPDGQPLYWLGFMVDVSDRKRAEGETVAALERLRAANSELERLSKAKSDFVSMISHEFRTPLTSIQGFSELLTSELLTPAEISDFATTINENAVRLARMIGDVLDLDRLEAGQTELRPTTVNIAEIVTMVLHSFRPTASGHAFITRFDGDLPGVTCDADLIIRVLTNLVANAIKYSPAGGAVTISVSGTDRCIRVSVADEGLGVPVTDLETIFERYARLTRPEQATIAGTGLGLPIARQIVELHGGRIWAESAGTGGTAVHFELPRTPVRQARP